MEWHYAKDGQAIGPVEGPEIEKLLVDGVLSPSDVIWNPELGQEWKPISEFPAFASATGPASQKLKVKRQEHQESHRILQEDYEKRASVEGAVSAKRKQMPRGLFAMGCPECGRKLKRWRDPDRAMNRMSGLVGIILSQALASLVCEHCGTVPWRDLSATDKLRSVFGSFMIVVLAIVVFVVAVIVMSSMYE